MSKLSKDEIERWITLDNGVHVPIKKGETEEDVQKRLDGWNKQNSKKESYHDYKDKQEMTERFRAMQNIMVNKSVVDAVSTETLADIYDTITDVRSKYRTYINAVALMDTDDGKNDSTMASMDTAGVMRLNPEYFEDREYLNDTYQACVNDNFHPKAPNGVQAVIAHELGHGIVHRKIFEMENIGVKNSKTTGDDRLSISLDTKLVDQWLAGHVTEETLSSNVDTKTGRDMYKYFYGKIYEAQDNIHNNEKAQKLYGDGIKSVGIKGLIQPDFSVRGIYISGYAKTSHHEMVAEAFCDVYCNGEQASIASKEVYNAFCKEMKR